LTSVAVCFCTLAIHAPYRRRARMLCADTAPAPWVILTDEPTDFADLPVRAVRHVPTGPMAVDYLERLAPTGDGRGAAAYHDKRFALQAALQDLDTAIFLDADSRVDPLPLIDAFPPGVAVLPIVRESIAAHLEACGSWRLPAFVLEQRIDPSQPLGPQLVAIGQQHFEQNALALSTLDHAHSFDACMRAI
jgi:hypothetical protein